MSTPERMVPWIRDLWATELEKNPEYRVGRGFLCRRYNNVNYHDPLGVLCELAVSTNVIDGGHWSGSGTGHLIEYKVFDGEIGLLPMRVVKWAKLKSANPCIRLSSAQRKTLELPRRYQPWPGRKLNGIPLAAVNDFGKASRERLADMIRTL